jgi:hypothetical protein
LNGFVFGTAISVGAGVVVGQAGVVVTVVIPGVVTVAVLGTVVVTGVVTGTVVVTVVVVGAPVVSVPVSVSVSVVAVVSVVVTVALVATVVVAAAPVVVLELPSEPLQGVVTLTTVLVLVVVPVVVVRIVVVVEAAAPVMADRPLPPLLLPLSASAIAATGPRHAAITAAANTAAPLARGSDRSRSLPSSLAKACLTAFRNPLCPIKLRPRSVKPRNWTRVRPVRGITVFAIHIGEPRAAR